MAKQVRPFQDKPVINKRLILLQRFSVLAGTYPIVYKRNELRVEKVCLIWSICIAVFLFLNYITMLSTFASLPVHLFLNIIIGSAVIPLFCHISSLVSCLLHRQKVNRYIQIVWFIESVLRSNGISLSHKDYSSIYELFAAHMFVNMFSCCAYDYVNFLDIFGFLEFFILTLNYTITTCIISAYIDDLRDRFQGITERLAEVAEGPDYDKKIEKLLCLSWAHGKLCSASNLLHKTFAFRLLTLTVICFISSVQNAYFGTSILIQLFRKTSVNQAQGLIVFYLNHHGLQIQTFTKLIWFLYYIQIPFHLSSHCSQVVKEVSISIFIYIECHLITFHVGSV